MPIVAATIAAIVGAVAASVGASVSVGTAIATSVSGKKVWVKIPNVSRILELHAYVADDDDPELYHELQIKKIKTKDRKNEVMVKFVHSVKDENIVFVTKYVEDGGGTAKTHTTGQPIKLDPISWSPG